MPNDLAYLRPELFSARSSKRVGLLLALAVTLIAALPHPALADTASIGADTWQVSSNGNIKGQAKVHFVNQYYSVCAEVGLQYRNISTNGSWYNYPGLVYNCNPSHYVHNAQATATSSNPCPNTIYGTDWRAYGFGVALDQNNNVVKRLPSSGWYFDPSPLIDAGCY